jgi:rhodanese-related sulfurtransferase
MVWVELGRHRGRQALTLLCRISLEPDVFSEEIGYVAEQAVRFGKTATAFIAMSLGGYLLYKYLHRQKLLRDLRVARITPTELKQLMDNGHESLVVDLRGALDHVADPYTIPGAMRIAAEELERRHHEIPRDRDIILFCACPNEATAARMAFVLKRKGITRVRPLAGGVDAWRDLAYPLEMVVSKEDVVATAEVPT